MKKKIFVLIFLAILAPSVSFSAPGDGTGGWTDDGTNTTTDRNVVMATSRLNAYTVATLPSSPSTGDRAEVADGADSADCTVGGGAEIVTCRWSGAAWVSTGDGVGAGTASGTVATLDGTGDAGAAATHSRGDHKHAVTPAGIGAQATITFGAGAEAALANAPDSAGGYALYNANTTVLGSTIGAAEVDADVATQAELDTVAALVDTDDEIIAIINASPSTQIGVPAGGTGAGTFTDGGLLVGAGAAAFEALAVGLTTQVLVGGGAGTNPAWGTDLPTAVTIGSAYIYRVGGTDVADADVADDITVSNYLPLSGASAMTGELTAAIGGIEFQETDTLTDCSTFAATGGGIFYDDSEGKFKKCQDNVLTDLDASGGGDITAAGDCATGECTSDAILDNEDISPTGGTWDLSSLTALTLPATFSSAASTSPYFSLLDSDAPGSDKEIGRFWGQYVDGADGSENGTVSIGPIEAGTITEYIQLDGKNLDIEFAKLSVFNAGISVPTGQSVAVAGTSYIAGGADPGDTGFVRMSNNTAISWEQSTPGTDIFLALDSSDIFQVGQNAANITLGGPTKFTTSMSPTSADGGTIGTTDLEVSDIYLADGGVIYGQADQSNTITSSATGWAFNLPITPTGGIDAQDPIIEAGGDGRIILASEAHGDTILAGAAETYTMPAVVSKLNFTLIVEGANAVVLDPDATGTEDTIYLNGTALAQGANITSSGTSGDMVVCQYRSADAWSCNGYGFSGP